MSVRTALFNLGFRPFYLLAALFAALAVPAWVADLSGHGWPAGYLEGLIWHQHEMVFGFVLAVIAGFLLTAGRLWTGRATPSGAPLALLVLTLSLSAFTASLAQTLDRHLYRQLLRAFRK